MAQSIYVTLATLKTETSVPKVEDKDGKVLRDNMGSVPHTLPRKNYPTPEIFDDEELFLAWAQESNALLPLLQAGVDKWLISDRATFKHLPKGKKWTPELGQENVDTRKWKASTKPEGAKTDKEKAESALSKLSPEELAELIAGMK